MRWIRYRQDDTVVYGILEGEYVSEISGTPFTQHKVTGKKFPLAKVKLEVPVVPQTFYCVGLNYVDHIKDPSRIPSKPDIGYRANNALIAHNVPVVIPSDARTIHYEGELVVVIGRQAKNISEEDALQYVLGYTIGNDVSERNWQREDRTLWRAKNSDTFKPMGPWIETELNLEGLTTTVRVNDVVTSKFATNNMLFGVAQFISAMTKYLTLYPGDVIWMGTDGHSPDLAPGDVVEVEISGIGTLRNKFSHDNAKPQ
ncbi:2-keto-4-pentenoate hydratase [Advenella sp. S44]|uniref:fumarylacetoacetate hydrolase family protein n=1 Tax=Advenella sp. S44 TaxID=1982755 RepID=UPI000C2A699E|nr:fumarylacetoacetate hydrolase family protein [Advenella sp. S44]PJX26168.1 2-keto-4-pentenoate hydratase [Advenella sp. S44]